jgi:hypothetical protein
MGEDQQINAEQPSQTANSVKDQSPTQRRARRPPRLRIGASGSGGRSAKGFGGGVARLSVLLAALS